MSTAFDMSTPEATRASILSFLQESDGENTVSHICQRAFGLGWTQNERARITRQVRNLEKAGVLVRQMVRYPITEPLAISTKREITSWFDEEYVSDTDRTTVSVVVETTKVVPFHTWSKMTMSARLSGLNRTKFKPIEEFPKTGWKTIPHPTQSEV